MSHDYDVIVIGAGLGGLCAGALLARCGRRVLVLERHDRLGGAATTFRRRHRHVEVGLHELDGLDDADPKGPLWRALGLDRALTSLSVPELYALRHPCLGEEFVLPHGVDAAQEALCQRFPSQRRGIAAFLQDLVVLRREGTRWLQGSRTPGWWLRHGPLFPLRFPALMRHMNTTLGHQLTRRLGDAEAVKWALAANIGYYGDDAQRLSLFYFAQAQGSYLLGGGHYLQGGSQRLSEHLGAVIRQAGGATLTRREVSRILMASGRVCGVGHRRAAPLGRDTEAPHPATPEEEVTAPVVIGNAAPAHLASLLPPDAAAAMIRPHAGRTSSASLWSVYLGLNRPASSLGVRHYSTFIMPAWMHSLEHMPQMSHLMAADPGERDPGFVMVDYDRIGARLTEPGHALVVLCGMDRLAHWQGLDAAAYARRKDAWMERLLAVLER
ncbi:MAG: NAD(P)-binding protein, partial [Magnetococcus sp. WYHC-3]